MMSVECTTTYDMSCAGVVDEEIQWDSDAMAYIRSRGDRYPEGLGIEPE